MTILQLVITRSPLGPIKLTAMGLGSNGMGETLETYRGGPVYILFKLLTLFAQLKAPHGATWEPK